MIHKTGLVFQFLILIGLLLNWTIASIAQDTELPSLADLDAGTWNVLLPGEETICSRGDPYAFQVMPAANPDADKLHIHFQGGGACWNLGMCREDSPRRYFSDVAIDEPYDIATGIMDIDNPDNPFGEDYHTVVVGYCTGDVHVGNRSVTYAASTNEVTIQHMGAVNAAAVLAWTFANFTDPAQVVISGSSAGAYGAIHHAPFVMDHYAGAPVVMIGDGGVGVIPVGWSVMAQWGLFDTVPEQYAGYYDPATFTANDLYRTYGGAYPQNTFAEYTTTADNVQVAFSRLMGILTPWDVEMFAMLDELEAEMGNFSSYVAGGSLHTILSQPEFYTYEVEGVTVYEWMADLLDGDGAESVRCAVCDDEPLPEMGG